MPTYTITDPWSLLLLRIKDRLEAEVPELKLIAKDMAQLETPDVPAIDAAGTALISFANFGFDEMGGNAEEGLGDVIVKIAKGNTDLMTNITPLKQMQDALDYLGIAQKVYVALQGWAPGTPYGSLTRRGFGEDLRRKGMPVAIIRFTIGLEDYSAVADKRTVPAEMVVDAQIELQA